MQIGRGIEMKIIFIRHSKADYSACFERGFIGYGLDLAELTSEGIEIAKNACNNPIFQGAEIIISSPFTRALHTAAILSRNLNLDLITEIDFREHTLDTTQQVGTTDALKELWADSDLYNKKHPDGESKRWEEQKTLRERVFNALLKYTQYKKVIIVSHGMLIHMVTGKNNPGYCGIVEMDYQIQTV